MLVGHRLVMLAKMWKFKKSAPDPSCQDSLGLLSQTRSAKNDRNNEIGPLVHDKLSQLLALEKVRKTVSSD
jgi:hypothetical protein